MSPGTIHERVRDIQIKKKDTMLLWRQAGWRRQMRVLFCKRVGLVYKSATEANQNYHPHHIYAGICSYTVEY